MNILPRLMYPLQMLPNSIPNSWFANLDKMFAQFIWQGKKARMKITKLQRAKDQGGLGVPNVRLYYWAAQMRYIYEWVNPEPTNTWIDMESWNCGLLTLKDCPFITYKKVKLEVQNNFIVRNTLNTWNKMMSCFGFKNHFSLLAPIWKNPDFVPSCHDAVYKFWHEKGLDRLVKLYEGGAVESFEALKSKYSLLQSHFFRYLQIRHYIPKNRHAQNTFLEDLLIQPIPKRFISHIYKTFGLDFNYSTDHIRKQWQNDIGEQIEEKVWTSIIKNTHRILSCNTERRFKILHRLHCTPLLRSRFGLGSPNCIKCCSEIGTYTHMVWKCCKIQNFWSEVKEEVATLLGYVLELTPSHRARVGLRVKFFFGIVDKV
uniref:Reverse transcriptase zinc-binding domain-containing protein n=1 Tax=Salarias fasciatus TaxID=181472 RepID=A0A672IS14_SALFA